MEQICETYDAHIGTNKMAPVYESTIISHNIMNNINLYHVFFVMADIRMLVHAIHYAVERLGFTEIKSLQLEVVLAIERLQCHPGKSGGHVF